MKFMVVNSYTMMEELTLCTWNTMDESRTRQSGVHSRIDVRGPKSGKAEVNQASEQ